MKNKTLKSNHAITLIALIITIVVMLILVAVTLTIALGDNGVVNIAKKASSEYEIAQKKDELIYYTAEYSQETGYRISEEALTKIAKISIKTGISPEKFIIYHDKYAIEENKANEGIEGYTKQVEEYIFYNWYKATVDEITYLESEETYTIEEPIDGLICDMSNRALAIDVNGDGYINDKDIEVGESLIMPSIEGIFAIEPYSGEKNVLYAKIIGVYTDDNFYEDGYSFPLVCISSPESYYDAADLDFLACVYNGNYKFTYLFSYDDNYYR